MIWRFCIVWLCSWSWIGWLPASTLPLMRTAAGAVWRHYPALSKPQGRRCAHRSEHDSRHRHECRGADVRQPVAIWQTQAGLDGRENSTGCLHANFLEYEEVVVRYADQARWQNVSRFLNLISALHDTVDHVSPAFRFRLISHDQDDDAFADAAIAAEAAFIITHDRHFNTLHGSGYRPCPITPEDFITRFLP